MIHEPSKFKDDNAKFNNLERRSLKCGSGATKIKNFYVFKKAVKNHSFK